MPKADLATWSMGLGSATGNSPVTSNMKRFRSAVLQERRPVMRRGRRFFLSRRISTR